MWFIALLHPAAPLIHYPQQYAKLSTGIKSFFIIIQNPCLLKANSQRFCHLRLLSDTSVLVHRFRSYKYLLISYFCLYHRDVITACLLEHVSTLSHPPFTTQKHIEKLFWCSIKYWLFMGILHNFFLWPNKICWNVMFFPEINFPPFMNLQNLDLMLHKDLCTVKNPETYGSLH